MKGTTPAREYGVQQVRREASGSGSGPSPHAFNAHELMVHGSAPLLSAGSNPPCSDPYRFDRPSPGRRRDVWPSGRLFRLSPKSSPSPHARDAKIGSFSKGKIPVFDSRFGRDFCLVPVLVLASSN